MSLAWSLGDLSQAVSGINDGVRELPDRALVAAREQPRTDAVQGAADPLALACEQSSADTVKFADTVVAHAQPSPCSVDAGIKPTLERCNKLLKDQECRLPFNQIHCKIGNQLFVIQLGV
jgi:hypothetical protein